MPSTTLAPTRNIFDFAPLQNLPGPAQLRVLLRTAGNKLRPAERLERRDPTVRWRQEALLSVGSARSYELATIHHCTGRGPVPTIVVGGFVPDPTESIFLIKDLLLRHGSVYCLNYPRSGFSLELLEAQLEDLVEESVKIHRKPPVIMAISFGCGVVMEWLRNRRTKVATNPIAGVIMVSPVVCVEDLLPMECTKPSTLLGRAVHPYLDEKRIPDAKLIERSRSIFTKMFESGAQNKAALSRLMNKVEAAHLRDQVIGTIRGIDFDGACARVAALKKMLSPMSYFGRQRLPLSEEPTLLLYAENEEAVIDAASPTRFVFESAHKAYFPRSAFEIVRSSSGSPVQHASLVFHQAQFRKPLHAFYAQLRAGMLRRAA